MKIYASHNTDAGIRRQSSAGGIFTILAEAILARGGTVYGAAIASDCGISHIRVDSPAALRALRGSKYAYSRIGTAVNEAMTDLERGLPVLFSGTPCQVAAMATRAAGAYPDRLTLVEVVCHGAPEHKYWDQYLDSLLNSLHRQRSDIAAINFRDKKTGWKGYSFTITFADGKTFSQPHDDNLYMRAFLADLTVRNACFRCPFKYPDGSRADITLGDFWGITRLAPEIDNDLGTTIILARTPHGRQLIDTLIPSPDATPTYDDIIRYNPAIAGSPADPAARQAFRADADAAPNIITIMKRYAGRPLSQTIRIGLARLKNRLLSK